VRIQVHITSVQLLDERLRRKIGQISLILCEQDAVSVTLRDLSEEEHQGKKLRIWSIFNLILTVVHKE
jgi:hypothetical protein